MVENIIYDINDDINDDNKMNYNNTNNIESFDINDYIVTNETENIILSNNHSNIYNNNNDYGDDFPQRLELFYTINYTIKMLERAFEYYNIKKKKGMKKDEMVQLLVLFECEPENFHIVQRRNTLLKYIDELKTDNYFKNFILY